MLGKDFKLKKGRFRLDIGKKSFMMRVVELWHRLQRGSCGCPSLVLKARLNGVLGRLI